MNKHLNKLKLKPIKSEDIDKDEITAPKLNLPKRNNGVKDRISDSNSKPMNESINMGPKLKLQVADTKSNIKKEQDVIGDKGLIKKDHEVIAKEVKVTPDGRNLEDIVTNLRGGKMKMDDQLEQIKNKISSTTINGKEKKDNRYTKPAEKIEQKKNKDKARIKNSKGYIQRNSRYTEEEKIIMRNLGFTPQEFTNAMNYENELTMKDKERLLAAGQVGAEKIFRGKRFRATVKDFDILVFLAKFKFANTKILSRLQMEPQSKTWRKLDRLKKGGLVADSEIIGMGTIWYLTEAGMAMTGYGFKTYRQRSIKTSTLPPIIGANHVASCLWNNKYNILELDDFPSINRHKTKNGEAILVEGETLISELEIRSSMAKETNPTFIKGESGGMYAALGDRARTIWHEWEVGGKNSSSPEFEIGNEYLWVLYPDSIITKSFHVPDLVVSRSRSSDGSPNSIAVEVELNQKSRSRYLETLHAYKECDYIYKKVIWITNNASIARTLSELADEIGLYNFDVVPMANENGEYKNRDIWFI